MVALICPHQPSCPGCPRLAEPGPAPDALSRLRALAERWGSPPPQTHSGPTTGFRRRARLAIRGRADAPKLGMFEAGSHRAVHIPRCLVHHPVVNRVASGVRNALAEQRLPTYSDAAHAGLVRYVQIVVERETDQAQVTLVTNAAEPIGLEAAFESLRSHLGRDLQGLWWNGNPERTNTILGPHWHHVGGEPNVRDRSGSAQLFYPPGSFVQSNLDLAMRLAARVRELARPGDHVVELYAGVGAIGLGLSESAAELHLNEVGAGSLAGLRLGVAALPAAVQAKVHVHAGAAADSASLVQRASFVIADPPRKGLEPALLTALCQSPPQRFAYVSCDVDSFERDSAVLSPAFRLTQLHAYDLFPHTEHLETLGLFERR